MEFIFSNCENREDPRVDRKIIAVVTPFHNGEVDDGSNPFGGAAYRHL